MVALSPMAAPVCVRLFLRWSHCGFRLCSPTLRGFTSPVLTRSHRLTQTDDELYQRTTVSVMQKEPDSNLIIYGYSSQGFDINRDKVIGPCAVVPPTILQWNVGRHEDITVESLSLFYLLEPHIDVLVLGTGGRTERLDPNVLSFMRKKGIAVEVQDTPNACATFNFLISEGRSAAAALIPPPPSSAWLIE